MTQGWATGGLKVFFAAGDRMQCCTLKKADFFLNAPLSFGVCCLAGSEGPDVPEGEFLPVGPQGALAIVTPDLPVCAGAQVG